MANPAPPTTEVHLVSLFSPLSIVQCDFLRGESTEQRYGPLCSHAEAHSQVGGRARLAPEAPVLLQLERTLLEARAHVGCSPLNLEKWSGMSSSLWNEPITGLSF